MGKRKTTKAAATCTSVSVGDIVWVSPDGTWTEAAREPGNVIKIGCDYEDDDGDDRDDGVMVKLQVSNVKVTVPVACVRPYNLDETTRASRLRTRPTVPSSQITQESPNTVVVPVGMVAGSVGVAGDNRAAVTPSPTAAGPEVPLEEPDDEIELELDNAKDKNKKRGRSPQRRATPSKKKPSLSQQEKTPEKNNDREEEAVQEDDEDDAAISSPYFDKSKTSIDKSDVEDDGEDEPPKKKAAVAKRSASKQRDTKNHANEKAKPIAKTKAKKNAPRAKEPAEKELTATKAAKKPKGKGKADDEVVDLTVENDVNKDDPFLVVGEESEEEDDDDKPYVVEYAPTGRSTCRRCDEVISKGTLRISHVPLFRGKPGFRVYRHLECMVLSEDIVCVEQIGGWRSIKKQSNEDFERVVLRIEESKVEREEEEAALQPDELVQVAFQGETRHPPKGIVANLLPFQVEGVSWMYHQEVNCELRGGILADEMGMGKTLQTITTILDNRPVLLSSKPGAKHPPSITGAALEARKRESDLWDKSVVEWNHEMAMLGIPQKMQPKKFKAARAGTLVVCPVIALLQWKTELEKFTEPNTFTIATYHGPNRAKEYPIKELVKYDIVLTTYQVLEADFRKMVSPNKVACPNCGGKFKIDKLKVHLKYFCGEGAQRTEAQMRQERTAERRDRGGDEERSSGRGGGKSKMQKKTFAKTTEKKKAFAKSTEKKSSTQASGKKESGKVKMTPRAKYLGGKKGQPIRATDEVDAKVEGEALVANTRTGGRPSRSAAKVASARMSAGINDWTSGAGKDDEASFGSEADEQSDDEEESVMSYEEEDSDVDSVPARNAPRKAQKKKTQPKQASESDNGSDDSEDQSSSEEESPALVRARKKQAEALTRAKKGKGAKKPLKKPKMTKGKGKDKESRKGNNMGKKKKFDEEGYSSSEPSESDDDVKQDPLEGIDLEALMEEAMEGSCMSTLHSVCWWRIVLDEAHMIKSRSAQTSAAAFSLVGINRWALSGTPLQNRVGELYSQIRFLRIDPMAYYFCRAQGCSCKSIHYRVNNGVCRDCGHRGFQHFSHFNKHVLNPIQRDGYSGDGRRAMFKLKNEVLDKCLLRRTKETRAEDMNLPPRLVTIRTINLHPVEKDFYDALYTQTKSSFSDYVAQGTLLNNYAHIFDLLTRMRQAVDHPYLIVYSKRKCEREARGDGSLGQPLIANGSTDCDICQELPTGRIVSTCCGAAFCRSCVEEYVSTAVTGAGDGVTPCPSCRAPFSIDLNQASTDIIEDETASDASNKKNDAPHSSAKSKGPRASSMEVGPSLKELPHVTSGSVLRRINLAEFATSTKIEALVQELVDMRTSRPGSKAIVFSQFVNMLDLIRWRLHTDPCLAEIGLGVRILHGSMDVKARDAALKDFREDGNVRVLLMSLKSGGVALNLTVASEVYLVDNWWNPAAEMQAIDRTHRLGQHRVIRAVRFIAEGTVEERVLQLQEKKRLVFDGTVGRDAGSLKALTVEDMKCLFQ